jgi:hypothetical protein
MHYFQSLSIVTVSGLTQLKEIKNKFIEGFLSLNRNQKLKDPHFSLREKLATAPAALCNANQGYWLVDFLISTNISR